MAAPELSIGPRTRTRAQGGQARADRARAKKPEKTAIPWTGSPVSDSVQRMGIPADRLPDETLLAGLGTGDPELSLAFVRRYQRIVFGVAQTIISDPTAA